MMGQQLMDQIGRLRSLLEVVAAELHYLNRCDARLFAVPLTAERFGRLQDFLSALAPLRFKTLSGTHNPNP